MGHVFSRAILLLCVAGAVGGWACARGDNTSPGPAPPVVPPQVYVAKIKNVLTGLPPTEQELQAVAATPARLSDLVDAWMALPEYRTKMLRFFQLAFQQTQVSSNDFVDQVFGQLGRNKGTTSLILQNAQESFSRTMLYLTEQGRPLTDAMTTRQLMMTTALKELYAFLDTWNLNNEDVISDGFRAANRTTPIIVGAQQGPIPARETLDPASPNYMHWYNPDVGNPAAQLPTCLEDPVSMAPNALSLHWLLLGTLDGRRLRNGGTCPLIDGTPGSTQFAASDFSDWKLVTIRPPDDASGEQTTLFYDLPALRDATELVLSLPRIGFFSTPAFFANWQTNVSNQMRVTLNQALIVATGASIDGTDPTSPPSTPGLDPVHAGPGECGACHKTLDPTRSIFAATWSWYYHHQLDPTWAQQPGLFAFRGVIAKVSTLGDFADVLAQHPLVGPGWVQKLCYYVNSGPCDESDPEFQRVVAEARASGFAWKPMLKAVLTSPLTTGATASAAGAAERSGQAVAVARRDHLCAALNARLGFTDACGLDAVTGRQAPSGLPEIAAGLPSDGYGRGSVAPVLPNQPSLFFQAGIENICKRVATEVIDASASVDASGAPGATTVKRWSSAAPDAAIDDFVATVMGLAPGDPRAPAARDLLADHFQTARQQPGASPTDALRSTFVVACQAPSAVSLGI